MQLMMSFIRLPNYSMYWSQHTHTDQIAKTMIIKRCKLLLWYLHVVNNTTKDISEKLFKLFKLFIILYALCNNCLKIVQK